MKLTLLDLTLAFSVSAFADQKQYVLPQKYIDECGDCHVAYSGELLPKTSWKHLITNLNSHYGNNASIDEGSVKEISNYLEKTSTYRKAQETKDYRITSANWFKREHSEEMPTKNENFSNCLTCHKSSNNGNFSLN